MDRELCAFFRSGRDSHVSTDLTTPKAFYLPDQKILKLVFNEDDYITSVRGNLKDLFVATFILRFRITELAIIGHSIAVGKETLVMPPSHFSSAHFPRLRDLLPSCQKRTWWKSMIRQKIFPLFGFSAVGCHIMFQSATRCRAFDYYDLQECGEIARSGPFCSKHLSEKWWMHPMEKRASVQAKMFSYYANIHNIDELGEGELKELVDNFWKRMQHYQLEPLPTESEVQSALHYFGYENREQHSGEPLSGLKRRFWDRAKLLHPDKGGSEEHFKTLSKHYDVLRSLRRWQAKSTVADYRGRKDRAV